jgi:hypothetical protein
MRHEILYVDLFLFEKIIYNFYKTFLTTTRERAPASRLQFLPILILGSYEFIRIKNLIYSRNICSSRCNCYTNTLFTQHLVEASGVNLPVLISVLVLIRPICSPVSVTSHFAWVVSILRINN